METRKVWFVTGASKGLGLALIKKLLQEGMAVAASSRQLAALTAELGGPTDDFLPLEVDLSNEDDVKKAIEACLSHFGRIDVLVNNAGYAQIGTLEELSDAESRANFDVNVFAALHAIRHVMPQLRKQRSGHIFNISSVGGYSGAFPGWGIYCATKFAMAGFTEALAEEVKEFGVKATAVYPGYFRTSFLSEGSVRTPQMPIAHYHTARESERGHLQDINGSQPNDPAKAAEALLAVSRAENPPVHLLLGNDALAILDSKTQAMRHDVQQWKTLSASTSIN